MPLNTCAFVVRVENKLHIVHFACLLQLKYIPVMQSKFTKSTPKIFSNRGAAPGAPVLVPPLYSDSGNLALYSNSHCV